MRAYLALFVLLVSTIGALAGEIRTGATMEVKPNSIWFEDAAKLTHWQQLKKSRRFAALAAYQREMLSQRQAWQFTNRLSVKILGHESGKNQVHVEMQTEGRMLGTTWFLDADTLVPQRARP
jgi:hypothetical protein